MRLQVKGRNIEVSPAIRAYAETKLAKLDKQLAAETPIEVELASGTKQAQHTADAIVFAKGATLRASESSADLKGSIDLLVENLERQVVKYREKRRQEPRRRAEHHGV